MQSKAALTAAVLSCILSQLKADSSVRHPYAKAALADFQA